MQPSFQKRQTTFVVLGFEQGLEFLVESAHVGNVFTLVGFFRVDELRLGLASILELALFLLQLVFQALSLALDVCHGLLVVARRASCVSNIIHQLVVLGTEMIVEFTKQRFVFGFLLFCAVVEGIGVFGERSQRSLNGLCLYNIGGVRVTYNNATTIARATSNVG